MTKIARILLLILSPLLLLSCHDDMADRSLCFVGDSLIARWDLSDSFPSRRTRNYGQGGARIGYIESLAGDFAGEDVVVLIGANDSGEMDSPEHREEYAERYLDAVLGLGAARLFIFSVPPRESGTDVSRTNRDILDFDHLIAAKVRDIPNVTYINIYPDFFDGDKVNPQYFSDGLHLSPYGYEILTKSLMKAL